MEYQKEKALLKKLKHLIENETDEHKQILLVNDYYNIYSYLFKLEVTEIDNQEYSLNDEISNNFNLLIEQGKASYSYEIINNFSLLDTTNKKLLRHFEKHKIKSSIPYYCNPIQLDEGISLLEEFFYYLGDDFYHIFNLLNEEQRISFTNHLREEGIAFDATFSDGAYIILKKKTSNYDYEFLASLAHEIGHCYEFYLNNEKEIYVPNLFAEVSSLFIEKLFNYYVINNHHYKEKALYSNQICQSIMYERCQVNDYLSKCIKKDSVIGIDLTTNYFNILKNNQTISLINSYNSQAIVNFPPSIENYMYVISDIIANNFVLMEQNNKEKALDEFRNFLLNVRTTNLEENILKYGSLKNKKVLKKF